MSPLLYAIFRFGIGNYVPPDVKPSEQADDLKAYVLLIKSFQYSPSASS